ncbi:hypothetical protein PPYR_11569 [Photinus pyralis]|uniref:HIG1 domain-containing protein n=1 Tax=Photinus pyralis TaxID=7054 RepID=A0A1Y1JYK0_PHOPY|nr:HIG1 domain family member 2A, mitochondrial [Photinus pyralis]KAB0794730.1 hypothetical protein PPYR_11569 [Photinus pyralis]
MVVKVESPPPELEWIKLSDDLDKMAQAETMQAKMKRKMKENPLVPIGCLATVAALCYGLWSFKQGRPQMSQKMMRMRIAAQGFTIVAFIVGLGLTARNATNR